MIERVQKRGVIVPSLVFATVACVMMLKEIPLLSSHPHFHLYLLGRIGLILMLGLCVALALIEFEFIFSYYPAVFYALTILYECHGQYYQPNYWLAYIQVTHIFPFIFYLDKSLLGIFFLFGLIAFDTSLMVSSQHFIADGTFSKGFIADVLAGTVISTTIAYIGASVFFTEKMRRNQIYQRFIDLGKNISSIVHDIKGMISGPINYSDALSRRVAAGAFNADDSEVITYLNEDILAIRDFVMEMNMLVSSNTSEKPCAVKLSDVVKSVNKVFKSRIRKVSIELVGDMTIKAIPDYLNRIIANSILNSCEAIHTNKIKGGRVTLYCESQFLGISDNSGTHLSDKILKQLNSQYASFSSKKEGSGMGVLIIKDYINAVGGKFKYSNHVTGVKLSIRFPKNMILSSTQEESRLI